MSEKILVQFQDPSFRRTIVSFFYHLVLSVTIGPVVAVVVILVYSFALQQGASFVEYIQEDQLFGYWLVIITIVVFGLVWLGYINSRKTNPFALYKSERHYTAFWSFHNLEAKDVPDLPSEAMKHYEYRQSVMDKALPKSLGFLLLGVISPVMAVLSYATRDFLSDVSPELVVNDFQWVVGAVIWLLVGLGSILVATYWLKRHVFNQIVDHMAWRRFWIGFYLTALELLFKTDKFTRRTPLSPELKQFLDAYTVEYGKYSTALENAFEGFEPDIDYLEWLEGQVEGLEQVPTIIIPPSLTKLYTFYGFALLIAGSFAEIIVEPARIIMAAIVSFLL